MTMTLMIASLAALAAYVCRLDALTWREHRPLAVLIHIAGAAACTWVLFEAIGGRARPVDALALVAPVAWIAMSYARWRHGPPADSRRCRGVTARS